MKTRMKQIRKKLGLTLTEVADLSNTHHSQISRIEREERVPNAETVVKICKALKISSDYFLMLDDYKEEKRTETKSFFILIHHCVIDSLSFFFS